MKLWFAAMAMVTLSATATAQFPQAPRVVIPGVAATAMDSIGDLDGDGVRDLILGIPSIPDVQIWSSRRGTLIASLATFAPVGIGASFGSAVANAGDIDNDGEDDILVGENGGPVYVFSGKNFFMIRMWMSSAGNPVSYGAAVSTLGDITGDGRPEVLVGDWAGGAAAGGIEGYVEVLNLSGPGVAVVGTLPGAVPFDGEGYSLATLGDLDGDGFNEFAVGAVNVAAASPVPGVARVYSGATLLPVASVVSGSFFFGFSVAGVGDATGDGVNDLAVGEPNFGGGLPSNVALYSGAALMGAGGGSIPPVFPAIPTPTTCPLLPGQGPDFGFSVSGVGDYDGDGQTDFLASEIDFNNNNCGPGACGANGNVFILSGATGAILNTLVAARGGPGTIHFGRVVTELSHIPTLPFQPAGVPNFAVSDFCKGAVYIY